MRGTPRRSTHMDCGARTEEREGEWRRSGEPAGDSLRSALEATPTEMRRWRGGGRLEEGPDGIRDGDGGRERGTPRQRKTGRGT
jgi:hypothetical protein